MAERVVLDVPYKQLRRSFTRTAYTDSFYKLIPIGGRWKAVTTFETHPEGTSMEYPKPAETKIFEYLSRRLKRPVNVVGC